MQLKMNFDTMTFAQACVAGTSERYGNMAKLLFEVFECGFDYGLLKAEEERDSEDLLDAAVCYSAARKFCVPSTPVKRREPKSERWRESKKTSFEKFLGIMTKYAAQ